jgi:ABC-type Fe3+ transport system permease subunit
MLGQSDLQPVSLGPRLADGSALGFILVLIMLVLLFGQAIFANRASGATEAKAGCHEARSDPRLAQHASGLVYCLLYVPIIVLIVLSFNKSGLPPPGPAFPPNGTASSSPIRRS